MKILIIEDERNLSDALNDKFVMNGFTVYSALDGEQGLLEAAKVQPDIIALDILMPKKNGFQVLEELKADPILASIPVIILSNLGQDEDIKKALKLGAEDYLVKSEHPINEIVEKFKNRILEKSK